MGAHAMAAQAERKLVYQDDLSHGAGNALQAAVATALGTSLADTPNFITEPGGYLPALLSFLSTRGLSFVKIPLPGGKLPHAMVPGTLCIHAAGSPRGAHKHC